MKSPKKNIRIKLLLYFIAISFIPLIIISYFSFKNSEEAIKKETFDHLVSVSILKQEEINEWLNQQALALALIGKNIENQAINLFEHDIEIEEHDLSHKNVNISLAYILKQYETEESGFFEFFILDKDTGEIHISTNKKHIGKIKKSEDYYTQGKKETYIKNIYYSLTLREPALTISTPIKDNEGNLLGVLAGRVKLGKINEIMRVKAGLGETGETYLVNKFNFLVTKTLAEEELDQEIFKSVVYTQATNHCLKQDTGLGLYNNYNNIPVIGSYSWIEERDICILSEVSQKEAFLVINRLKIFIGIITLIVLFIILLLGIILSRTITKPLLQLTKGADKIGKGNLKHRIVIESEDELGRLADSFNEMAKALDKSYEELKTLDKMKDEFISMASHELRTPISTMKGFLSMILSGDFGKLNKEGQKSLKIIEISNNRLGKLVDDLLNVSRIEQGRLQIRLESINIEKIVYDITDQLILKVKEKKLELTLDIEEGLSLALADEDRLKQVLINLIDNAIKYTEKGWIEVSVKKESNNIKVSIKDSGIGMSKKDQEKLFTKFYRIKRNKTIGIEGTGLGLWITKQIVELMNGKIYVDSKKNIGTQVSFTIPIFKK